MKMSFNTFALLLDLHDPEATTLQDVIHDMEWSASKDCCPRPKFSVEVQDGELILEGHDKNQLGW